MGLEVAFYDVETTVPLEAGQRFELLEFAAVVVSIPEFSESSCYSTLIRPSSDLLITSRSVACNGITVADLADAPTFSQVADTIYTTLHGKVWAGHNILRFDNVRIKEAFSHIHKPPPKSSGMIDTLPLLKEKFGVRAGNMKMASLASYFGLGEQAHRSLSDVRMNLEVLKRCATLLFLESCFPEIILASPPAMPSCFALKGSIETSATSGVTVAQNRSSETVTCKMELASKSTKSISQAAGNSFVEAREKSRSFQIGEDIASGSKSLADICLEFNSLHLRQSSGVHANGVEHEAEPQRGLPLSSTNSDGVETSTLFKTDGIDDVFLEAKDIVPIALTAEERPSSCGGWKVALLHQGLPLQILERRIRVKYGLSDVYSFSGDGNPKFTIVVEPSAETCNIINICDSLAREHFPPGSISTWRNPVLRKDGGVGRIRIKVRTTRSGTEAIYITRFYKKDMSTLSLIAEDSFQRVDATSFRSLIYPGCVLDIGFTCGVYSFNGYAGLIFAADTIIF